MTHVDEQHNSDKQKKAKKNAGRKSRRPTPAQQAEAAAKLGGNQLTKKTIKLEDIKDET